MLAHMGSYGSVFVMQTPGGLLSISKIHSKEKRKERKTGERQEVFSLKENVTLSLSMCEGRTGTLFSSPSVFL
jgi:hypothetical protein